MGIQTATDRSQIKDEILFASYPTKEFNYYEFEYAAPVGDESATINQLIIHDLVYVSSPGKIKKLTPATVLDESSIIGVVNSISDINHNLYNTKDGANFQTNGQNNGRLFTASGGVIRVYTGTHDEYPIFSKKLYLHTVVVAGDDTRTQFDFATHGTGAGVLAGRVRQITNNIDNPTIRFN
jgi:hypothetical protein